MANTCQARPVLVEIPAPQPRITGRVRRSYLDVLNARMTPVSWHTRTDKLSSSIKHVQPSVEAVIQSQLVWKNQGEVLEESQSDISKQQLVQLLSSLILIEQKQRSRLPRSDLKVLLEDLHHKKTNVYRSIPYSRLGSNRDAHCYRKAYTHLMAFKRSCQEVGQVLLQSGEWELALEYFLVAWRYASELPHWDTSSHNAIREQCYHSLAIQCATALQQHRPGPSKARELLCRFKMAQAQSKVISPCVEELQKLLEDSKNRTMSED